MRNITSVKVVVTDKKECIVYVNYDNNESGVYYKTGNKWHSPKSLQNMTATDLAEAKRIAVKGGKWFTTFVNGTAREHSDYQELKSDDALEMQIKATVNRIAEA